MERERDAALIEIRRLTTPGPPVREQFPQPGSTRSNQRPEPSGWTDPDWDC